MALMLNLILFLFTIALNIYKCNTSSCSFNINATAQTPFRFDNLTTRSPDCDDTAIIINEGNMSDSLIVGTLKEGGLELYRLNGNKIQSIPAPNPPNNDTNNAPGRFNNVAAINCLSCSDTSKMIVIVTDRGLDQLRFYMLNDNGLLDDVTFPSVPWVFSANQSIVNEQQTAYGLTATNYGGKMRALVSKKHQNVVAVVDIIEVEGLFIYERVDMIELPLEFDIDSGDGITWTACVDTEGENPQIEGMVVDPMDGTLLIAQEGVGLFKTSLNKSADADYNFTLIDGVREFGMNYTLEWDTDENETVCVYDGMDYYESGDVDIKNGRNIVADAEGLSLYQDEMTNGGYYVLSCQGGSFYNIYSRNSFKFMGNFSIYYDNDKTQHTDGVEIGSGSFGNNYPEGIIIVQDEGEINDITVTNFKFASFEYILDGIDECDEDINSTSFYTTTGDGGDDSGGDGMDNNEDHKTTITILGIVFGVLLVSGIALCLYFSCFQNCRKGVKQPDNYVELQNK